MNMCNVLKNEYLKGTELIDINLKVAQILYSGLCWDTNAFWFFDNYQI